MRGQFGFDPPSAFCFCFSSLLWRSVFLHLFFPPCCRSLRGCARPTISVRLALPLLFSSPPSLLSLSVSVVSCLSFSTSHLSQLFLLVFLCSTFGFCPVFPCYRHFVTVFLSLRRKVSLSSVPQPLSYTCDAKNPSPLFFFPPFFSSPFASMLPLFLLRRP